MEMLVDRGFPEIRKLSAEHWEAHADEEKNGPITAIYFIRGEKVGIDNMRDIKEAADKYHAIIIIYDDAITPSAKVAITRKMQLFHVSELAFNITRHKLVPRHRLASPEETQAILRKFRVTREQLPRIPVTDPVIKYYGFPCDSLVIITRNFGVQIGVMEYPRVVVKNA